MNFNRFEDIVAWQKAREVTREIYKIFKQNKDLGFRDQLQRASVSIMNNIAEGFERKTNPDFKRFLFISKASCSEVRSMLYVAKDNGYISEEQFQNLISLCIEISKITSGLIKKL